MTKKFTSWMKRTKKSPYYEVLEAVEPIAPPDNPYERITANQLESGILFLKGIKTMYEDADCRYKIALEEMGMGDREMELMGHIHSHIEKECLYGSMNIQEAVWSVHMDRVSRFVSPFGKMDQKSVHQVINWLRFFVAPSAKSHHGNYPCGLLEHTRGVCHQLRLMRGSYSPQEAVNWPLLMIAGLYHDMYKLKEYDCSSGSIEYSQSASFSHDVMLVIDLKSIFIKSLSDKDIDDLALMILCHHGKWSEYQPNSKRKLSIEVELLHLADMIDSRMVAATDMYKKSKEV